MPKLNVVIPKGRINKKVLKLLNDSGFGVEVDERVYIPRIEDSEMKAKIMKPQNIPKLVEIGSHDIGFTGNDWVVETQADVVEIMDLHFDKVRIVASVPEELLNTDLKDRRIVVASEYERIASMFLEKEKYNFILLRTFGATEVFPPDDADMIVDNVSTGRTLKEHNLHIIHNIMESSTRFIANKDAMQDPWKYNKIMEMKMIFQSVFDAHNMVMLEMNVPEDKFEDIIKHLPCMQSPTVAQLYGQKGFAVKIAVKKSKVVKLIPKLKKKGATDILEYDFGKVVL